MTQQRKRLKLRILLAFAITLPLLAGQAFAFSGLISKIERGLMDHAPSSVGAAAVPQLPPAGTFAPCHHIFPDGLAIDPRSIEPAAKPVALCASNFAVLYSGRSKTPMVVVEKLNRKQLSEALDEKRTDEFFADPRLQRSTRAELDDYRGSGYDRGHLAPAGDQPDQMAMAQSFALSNMVPQDPTHNRKVWSKVESDVRKFARRAQGNVFVFSGPLFRGQPRTIGRNQVWVPSHLFKLVYDEASGRAWAYVQPNTADARVEAPMSYSSFVQQTGWQLLGRAPG